MFMQINAVNESNPDVGSSKIKTYGFDISSIPILVLFLSPPEIPFIKASPTYVFWQFLNFKSLIT